MHPSELAALWGFHAVKVDVIHQEQGVPQRCFDNAFNWVAGNPGALYVLGYVVYCEMPIEHAWVKQDGVYLEVTLPDSSAEYWVCWEGTPVEPLEFYQAAR